MSCPTAHVGSLPLAERSRAFLDYLDSFQASLPAGSWREVIERAGGAEKVAVVLVDLTCGFARQGALASPRVAGTLPAVLRTLAAGIAAGVREVALVQDAHSAEAREFGQFAPHCIAGSAEAETLPEITAVLADLRIAPALLLKNSLLAAASSAFRLWELAMRERGVNTYVLMGDCTDLCITSLAVPLVATANEEGRPVRVILPADCLATYDLPVEAAAALGVMPHDGDLLHAVFLYHLALTGSQVYRSIA